MQEEVQFSCPRQKSLVEAGPSDGLPDSQPMGVGWGEWRLLGKLKALPPLVLASQGRPESLPRPPDPLTSMGSQLLAWPTEHQWVSDRAGVGKVRERRDRLSGSSSWWH